MKSFGIVIDRFVLEMYLFCVAKLAVLSLGGSECGSE